MQELYLRGCVKNMGTDNHYEIILTDIANNELEKIYQYIADTLKEPTAAKKLMEKIENSILRLEDFPYSCVDVHIKPHNKIYKKLVIEKYIVLYRVEETNKQVVIFHIYYAKRDYLK